MSVCENKMSTLTQEWNNRLVELKKDEDSTIVDVLAEGVVLTGVIWSGSRSKLGRRLVQSIIPASKSVAFVMSKRLSSMAPGFASWIKMSNTATSAGEMVASADAVSGTGLALSSNKLINSIWKGKQTASTPAPSKVGSLGKLRKLARFGKIIKGAGIAITVWELGNWAYDSFFSGSEATDEEIDESANAITKVNGTIDNGISSFSDNIAEEIDWTDYGKTDDAVRQTLISLNSAVISRGMESNDAFVQGLRLLLHQADQFVDDGSSSRALGLLCMSVGAGLYNQVPYALVRQESSVPQNDVVNLIASMLLNMSDCSGVLTPADIDDISSNDFSSSNSILTNKQSAAGVSQYYSMQK